jgi:hypothetical protein
VALLHFLACIAGPDPKNDVHIHSQPLLEVLGQVGHQGQKLTAGLDGHLGLESLDNLLDCLMAINAPGSPCEKKGKNLVW